ATSFTGLAFRWRVGRARALGDGGRFRCGGSGLRLARALAEAGGERDARIFGRLRGGTGAAERSPEQQPGGGAGRHAEQASAGRARSPVIVKRRSLAARELPNL